MFFPMFALRGGKKRDEFLTLYDSPRFPRQVWDTFRAQAAASGEMWVDVLRELMEGYTATRKDATKD